MRCVPFLLAFIVLTAAVQCQAPTTSAEHYLLVGTYTSGKSEGIYVYKFNSTDGSVQHVSTATGISNPSFLTVAPDNKHVYSVSEGEGQGSITAFSFDKGKMTTLNSVPSGGSGPCYVAMDRTGKWLATGNYGSGTVAIIPVKKDGSLETPSATVAHEGKSANPNRQEKPHVHATMFSGNNRYLFVPDLGIDKVMIYTFDEKNGKLSAADPAFASSDPGSGPRHMDFHPSGKYVYLMEELTGTISVFDHDNNGRLSRVQKISSHPADFKGVIGSADIHVSPDGKFLYASNRGESNTIAIFSINDSDGKLTQVGHQSTMGSTPRNFNLDPTGNFLLVANQASDNIVIFKRNRETGLLTPLKDQLQVPNPVCIKWAKVD